MFAMTDFWLEAGLADVCSGIGLVRDKRYKAGDPLTRIQSQKPDRLRLLSLS